MIGFRRYISHELRIRVEQVPWFGRCGIRESIDVPIKCRQVESLSDAQGNWRDQYGWQSLLIDTLNRLRCHLHDHHRRKYHKWNRIVKEAEKLREKIVYPRAEQLGMTEALKITIRYVVGGYLLEEFYSDCDPPRTYDTWFEICRQGHFPCGWEGVYPDVPHPLEGLAPDASPYELTKHLMRQVYERKPDENDPWWLRGTLLYI